MASSNNMIYTRVCVDCGKVMRNVGRRAERCPECRAVHIRVKALEASYRERTEQLIRQQEERAGAIHQGLVDDNERFTASAGTYGKGRMRNICRDEYQKEAARLDRIGDIVPLLRQMAGIAGFEIIGRIPLRDKATGKEYR